MRRKIIARWSSALVRFRHADRRPLRLASARDRLAGIAIKAANARPFSLRDRSRRDVRHPALTIS